ncbi:thymidylate synthase [Pseudomonas nicosulfuronedens]|uniref:thymidylate synthase n=1 Tax=Pseudomonas nicosulfuronedens TaxID=2571105 RepID=UPI0024486155|nr:thymidylate synthase [Pseudomonas nicosulfuronedens]MDH1009614.1 thymidylate synthase [Pseudomonas nicosulfuronedens]MDH1980913.1 thymidylate synthase [Pseudomonas nicosulfuronedens]MDH2030624.1 thymidylate synthase [Pseudomonas nicosulfuronedens]
MYLVEETLDDLLMKAYPLLLEVDNEIAVTKGDTHEIPGVLLKLKNPRGRLSRTEGKGTIFSCLGELLWYLSGSNKLNFIQYYIKIYDQFSDDGKSVYGAYGPRLFGSGRNSQVFNIIKRLKRKSTSRKAVIQLFSADDIIEEHEDVPCTCTLQFLLRDKKLSLYTSMRSNDAYKGLPHDVFAFTMLQEIIARELDVELGEYSHYVGSLHIYKSDIEDIKVFIKESWQDHIFMPAMPQGSQLSDILKTLQYERKVRAGNIISPGTSIKSQYWQDIAHLLALFSYSKDPKKHHILQSTADKITHKAYNSYKQKRLNSIFNKGRDFVRL